jgi:hypothetical protein
MLTISLTRKPAPEERPELCALCGVRFTPGVVLARLEDSSGMYLCLACPRCVEYMGRHPSGRFPTIQQYQGLAASWRTPSYGTWEEAYLALYS